MTQLVVNNSTVESVIADSIDVHVDYRNDMLFDNSIVIILVLTIYAAMIT